MGRSKFTFPVPGRKQKPPFGPIVSGPMSKAQKILGIAEINIDEPRQWDAASTSGISISVSESTATCNHSERNWGPHNEHDGFTGRNRSNVQWEQESETMPAYLTRRFSQMNTDAGPREFTDASSLTRRGSSSTITSWYDKSKMPLSISQQTSSSAMAKGFPQKASMVLDIEGQSASAVVPQESKSKKQPSRLDLVPLLSRHKHRSLLGHSDSKHVSHVLGSDNMTELLPLACIPSPEAMPPPPAIQQRTEKRSNRRNTLERVSETSTSGRPRTGSSSRRGANDVSMLPNLYEHYEQMSFDHVLGHDGPLAKPESSMVNGSQASLRSFASAERRRSVLRPGLPHREGSSYGLPQAAYSSVPELPNTKIQQATSADRDCGSSVSSRHTKASKISKISKRASQSLNGSDLMEKSVLSLSSDSEEDGLNTGTVSQVGGRSRSSDAGSQAPSVRSTRSRDAPSLAQSSRKSVKHASFAPTNNYLAIPSKTTPPPSKTTPPSKVTPPSKTTPSKPLSKPPSVNARTSSLPPSRYQTPVPSKRVSSRYSTVSTSPTNSGGDWPTEAKHGVQDARAAGLPSVQQSYPSSEHAAEPMQRAQSAKSSSVHSLDQPTPPLSPTSVQSSITSTTGSTDDHANSSDSRFMAVTRQEEMLLAALRMKRARMRESILAEYEDETRSISSHRHHRTTSSQIAITEMEWPAPPQTLRHQTSATSNSTIKAGSRTSEGRPGSLASGRGRQRSNSRPVEVAPSSHTRHTSSSRRGSSLKNERRPSQEAPATESRHERILLYLDRPVGNVHSTDCAEPSPDLSDFMDFDNDSEEDDELSSDPSLYRTRDPRFGVAANKGRGRKLKTNERPRPDASALRQRIRAALAEQVRVVEAESDIDAMVGIPRPDSPVSPEGTLSLPGHGLAKKRAVRLSAVGNAGVRAGWWGDDN